MITRQNLTTKLICTLILVFVSLASIAQSVSSSDVEKKDVDGTEKYFYKGKLMNGYYRVYDEYHWEAASYKAGIKDDSESFYCISDNALIEERIDLKHKYGILKRYWSGENREKLRLSQEYSYGVKNGIRKEWNCAGELQSEEHYINGQLRRRTCYWKNEESAYVQIEYYGKKSVLKEKYAVDISGKKNLTKRILRMGNSTIFENYNEGYDSTYMDTLEDGYLTINYYKEGNLYTTERYDVNTMTLAGLCTVYSSEGKVLSRKIYCCNNYLLEEKYYNLSDRVKITEVSPEEYRQLLAGNCNVQLEDAPSGYVQKDKDYLYYICINTQVGEKSISAENGRTYRLQYKGYYPTLGIHFISYTDTENEAQFYLMSDKSGEWTENIGCQQIAICKTTGLFAEIGIFSGKTQYLRVMEVDGMDPENWIPLAEYDFGNETGEYRINECTWINENTLLLCGQGSKPCYMRIEIDLEEYFAKASEETPEEVTPDYPGLTITKISEQTYDQLLTDSCNLYPIKDTEKFSQTKDSLTIRTPHKELTFLNLQVEGLDFREAWSYKGYAPSLGLHFFHAERTYEDDYIEDYVANDLKGEITEIQCEGNPILCNKSNLFATRVEDPHSGETRLIVYKVSDSERLIEVACYSSYNYILGVKWVGESTLVAIEQHWEEDDNYHIRIDIDAEALEKNTPLELSELDIEKQNFGVRENLYL